MQNSQHKPQDLFQQDPLNSFISFFLINGPRSKFSQYFQFLTAEIQFLAILTWMHTTSLGYEDDTTSFSFLHNISQRLVIRGIFEDNMASVLSKIAWIYLFFICVLILYAIFKASKRQKLNPQLQMMMSSLFQFHSGFVFWVVNVILMTLIAARWQRSNILRSYIQNQDQTLVIISLILIIFNYGFGVLGAIFCFDPFCSTNIFAERISSFQILNFLFKAVLAPQAIFTDPTRAETQIFFVVIALLVSVVRLTILLRKFPFYYYKPMKLALIFGAIGLWISLINIITIICQKNGTSSPMSSFYLILVPLPIVVKVVLVKFKSLIQFYVVAHPKSLQTTAQVYKKLFVYRFLAEKISLSLNENKPSRYYELYFIGNLNDHAKTCKDMDCFCLNYLNTTDPGINSTKNLLPAYFSSAALSLLSESISKFRDNMDLKIALADLIFTRAARGLTAALASMFSTPQENVSFYLRVKKDILGRKIQERMIEYLTDNENSKLNLVKFIDYQADSANFLSKITEVTNNYLEFWDTYRKSNLKISEVMSKSIAIENAADEVDKHWNVSIEKYEAFYHHMKNQYRLYLSLVRNMPYASNQIINKFKWKKRLREPDFSSYQLTQDDLNSSQTLTVHISMARERLGRITSVCENIQGSTGYTSRDLIGKNISFLMPSCIAEKHDELLLRRLDRLKRTSQTEDSYTWPIYIKAKAGHIIPCSAYVTLFPYIQQELIYTAIIKVITSKYEYIITDSMGYIDGYTEALGTKLGLSSEKREHIREVCPNICKVYSKLDKNFLYFSSQENSRTVFNSFNKSQVANAIDEVNPIDSFSTGVSLTFIRKQSPDKSYRYLSTLNKKVLINKSVYIFQLEPSYDGRQDQKTPRDYVKNTSHKYTFEESDLDPY